MLKQKRSVEDIEEVAQGQAHLHVELVNDFAALERHAKAWNSLALTAPQRLAQLSHAWVVAYLEHRLAPHESWMAAFAYEAATLVGVLCVRITPHVLFGRWHPILRAPFDAHTRSGDALLAEGYEDQILQKLVACATAAVPGCLGVELRGVHERSRTLTALNGELPDTIVIRADDAGGLVLRTSGRFEEFQGRLSDKFRASLRNAHNRLAKLSGVETQCVTPDRFTENDLARFAAVEAAGWKGRKGTAIAESQSLVAFYSSLTRRLAAQNWLVLYFLTADERTIAGHLMVQFGNCLLGVKTGYDEAYRQYAPGKVLFEEIARLAFRSGDIDEINGLTDAAWLQGWQMEPVEHYCIWLYRRGLFAHALGVLPTRLWLLIRFVLRPLLHRVHRARFRLRQLARAKMQKLSATPRRRSRHT